MRSSITFKCEAFLCLVRAKIVLPSQSQNERPLKQLKVAEFITDARATIRPLARRYWLGASLPQSPVRQSAPHVDVARLR